jgi:hypothetical protein
MGFGIVTSSKAQVQYEIYLNTGNGYKQYSSNTITITKPTTLVGYIAEKKTLNIYINGILANEMFSFTYKPSRVDFTYTGDVTKYTKPVVITLEIEK